MIRVAFIAGTYRPQHCGVADYTAHLRQALSPQVESIVLTTDEAARSTSDPTVQGVVHRWHVTQLGSLIQAIHQSDVDLLHIQHAAGTYSFDRAIFLLPLLLQLSGWKAPIVTTVHEYGWWEWQPRGIPARWLEWLKNWGQQRQWWDREDGFLLTRSAAIITTNASAERVIQARLPDAIPTRIPIAANVSVDWLDRTAAKQTVCQQCHWPEQVQIIAFFGFLHPVKGIETLLSAFQQVVAAQPQARLLLIGGVESLALPDREADRYWQSLQQLIDQLNLSNKVYMTGYTESEQVSEYLLSAEIGVLPFNHGVTLKSGSLLALMAHQLPIIATRATPPDPALEHPTLLQLIPARDASQLADQLIQLLNDRPLQNQLAAAGYQFSRQFAWPSIADRHLKIYESVLESAIHAQS